MRRRPAEEVRAFVWDYYRNRDRVPKADGKEDFMNSGTLDELLRLSDSKLYEVFSSDYSAYLSSIPLLLNRNAEHYRAFVQARIREQREHVAADAPTHYRLLLPFVREYEERFAQVVRAMCKGFLDDVHYARLGRGTQADVYAYRDDAHEYAIRILQPQAMSSGVNGFLDQLEALLRVSDMDAVPHVHAFSFLERVIVMDKMPGDEVRKFQGTPRLYPEDALRQLFSTAAQLIEREMVLDAGNAKNILYSEEEGFSIIDFHYREGSQRRKPSHNGDYDPEAQLRWLVRAIADKEKYSMRYSEVEMAIAHIEGFLRVVDALHDSVPRISQFVIEECRHYALNLVCGDYEHIQSKRVQDLIRQVRYIYS